MTNPMTMKSPNLVRPIPRRNNEEVDIDNGIIYPPGYSVASPIPIDEPNIIPVAPAVLIDEPNIIPVAPAVLNEECCLCCEGGDISPTGGGRGTNNNEEQLQAQEEMGPCDSIGGFVFTFIFLVGCVSLSFLLNYKNNTEPTTINSSATTTMYPTITPWYHNWYHNQDFTDYEYYPQSHHHHNNSTVYPTASFVPSPSPLQNESSSSSNP